MNRTSPSVRFVSSPGQVAGFIQDRAGCALQPCPHLIRDDMGQGRFSQSGRAGQEDVVQRFPPFPGCGDEHAEVVHDLLLSVKIAERRGA